MRSELPDYLTSFEAFAQHIRDEIGAEAPTKKGSAFSRAAAVLLPATDAGRGFTNIEQNGRLSHDKGIDAMSAVNTDGRQLFIQSKLTLDRKADLDSILSQFYQYEREVGGGDSGDLDVLFDLAQLETGVVKPTYCIVTLSDPAGVVAAYEKSSLATRDFYLSLQQQERLAIVGGRDLYEAAQREYSRSYMVPDRFAISSQVGWLAQGHVRIGVVKARDLYDLYQEHGDGLFFENIRSFLGLERNLDRETVNRRILVDTTTFMTRVFGSASQKLSSVTQLLLPAWRHS
jgi:hypothetical protein